MPAQSLYLDRPPQLDIVEMTKRFGRFTALDKVSMTLKPGTVHALLGENGAGKSTLVKCVMGFYQPTTGQVLINQRRSVIKSPKDAHALRKRQLAGQPYAPSTLLLWPFMLKKLWALRAFQAMAKKS